MRVWLVCHQYFPEFYSGTETITALTAFELARRGVEVTVIAGHPELADTIGSVRAERYDYQGVPVIRFRSVEKPQEESSAHPELTGAGESERIQFRYVSEPVRAAMDDLLNSEPLPDLVHVLHFANLGTAIFDSFSKRALPVVLTSTDFFSICPLSHLRYSDGTQCQGPREDQGNCVRHILHNGLPDDLLELIDGVSDEDLGNLAWLASNDIPEAVEDYLQPGFARQAWFRDLASDLARRKRLMSQALMVPALIITPSAVARSAFANVGISESRLRNLPFGINSSMLVRNVDRGQQEELRLVFIGQIARHKGLEVLVRAVRSLGEDCPVRLTVYGDLQQDPHYSASVLALSESDPRISFSGSFAPEMLGDKLADQDVIVIPSLWSENTPVVLLASQTAGCPAIVSREPGLCEIVDYAVNGLSFATGDEKELAVCIKMLVQDRNLVRRLAANTEECLSIEAHVNLLMEEYGSLLSGSQLIK